MFLTSTNTKKNIALVEAEQAQHPECFFTLQHHCLLAKWIAGETSVGKWDGDHGFCIVTVANDVHQNGDALHATVSCTCSSLTNTVHQALEVKIIQLFNIIRVGSSRDFPTRLSKLFLFFYFLAQQTNAGQGRLVR
jgi:hypothetical protein